MLDQKTYLQLPKGDAMFKLGDKVLAALDDERRSDFEANFISSLMDNTISGKCFDACSEAVNGNKVMVIKACEGKNEYSVTVDGYDCPSLWAVSELKANPER